MAKQLNVNLAFTANTDQAKAQLKDLQQQLSSVISSATLKPEGLGIDKELMKSVQTAGQLKSILKESTTSTGSLDLGLLNQNLKKSGKSLQDYANDLNALGPEGQQAFNTIAQSITTAGVPLKRTNALLNEFATTLKNTARWQISSSILHGFMGAVQSAYGYAQDLNESLNNIRIVTGQNSTQMAKFAAQANKAAQALSTTTTDYTDAALIYYQQGLSDEQVKQRTDVTVKMANVTRESAQEVSDQMTAIWNNFDDGSKSLEHYADVLTALGATTASSTAEISTGLEKFASVADMIGLSYENAAAALATVTATTRQSADVVGTAFKTIFARIQGLKLGETLDDGTSLNKYSEALQTVGINIKDQSGDLKDMDSILAEMGAKWTTLSKDQQVALAQTVAGVRQYNQLVALMDNWDYFEQNLATAQNSDGALQKQADIYAESWEAAQKRVKAAAQEIYGELLNDDFFIDVLDGFEKFLSAIGGLIEGLGGVQGVLLTIGTIITNVYKKDLAQGLDNLFYNITRNSSRAKQEILDLRQTAIKAVESLGDASITGSANIDVFKMQGKLQDALLTKTQSLLDINRELTDSERSRAQLLMDTTGAIGKQVVETAKLREIQEGTGDQKKSDLKQMIKSGERKSRFGDTFQYISGQNFEDIVAQTKQQQIDYTVGQKISTKYREKLKSSFASAGGDPEKEATAIKEINEHMQKTIKAMDQAGTLSKELAASFNDIAEASNKVDLDQAIDQLDTVSSDLGGKALEGFGTIQASAEALEVDTDKVEKSLEGMQQAYQNIGTDIVDQANKTVDLENATEGAQETIDGFTGDIPELSERFVSLAGAISSTFMAISMLKGLGDIWNDEDMSTGEKVINTMTTLVMVTMTLIPAYKSLKDVKLASLPIDIAKALGYKGEAEAAGEATIATYSLAGALRFLAGPVGWVILAITALVGVVYALVKAYSADAEALNQANKVLETATTNYENAKNAAESFKASIKGYEDGLKSLKELTGTQEEVTAAIEASNEKARELIETYKLFDKYTKGAKGEIIIDENALKEVQSKLIAQENQAQMNYYSAQLNQSKKQIANDATNLGRDTLPGYFTGEQVQELSQAINEVTKANDGIQFSAEELRSKLEENSSQYQLSYGIMSNLNSIVTDDTVPSLYSFTDSVNKAAEANLYYAQQILPGITETTYNKTLTGMATDKEGNFDQQLYDNLSGAVTKVLEQDMGPNIDEWVKNTQEKLSTQVLSDVSTWDAADKTESNIQDFLKETLGEKYSSDYVSKNYQDIFKGTTLGYDGDINSQEMARSYYESQGYKVSSVQDKSGITKLSGTDASGQSWEQDVDNEVAQSMWAQQIANYAIQQMASSMSTEALSEEQIQNMLGGLTQAGEKFGANFTQSILAGIQSNGALDFSSLYGEFSQAEIDQMRGMSGEELAQMVGLRPEDLSKLGLGDAEAFRTAFEKGLEGWTIDQYIGATNTAGEVKAKDLGLDVEEFKEYRDLLQDTNKEYEDNVEGLNDVALANKRMEKGVKSLSSNWESWNDIMTDSDSSIEDISTILPDVNTAIQDILDLDTDQFALLPNDFAKKNWKLINDATSGVEGAIDDLRHEAGQEILLTYGTKVDADGDGSLDAAFQTLHNMIATYESPDFQVGVAIDDAQFINACNNIIQQAGMTATEAQGYFASMGYDAKLKAISPEKVTTSKYSYYQLDQAATEAAGGVPQFSKTPTEIEVTSQSGATAYALETITPTGTYGGGTGVETTSSKTATASKTKGGGGGGGGGKSQKKETKKLGDEKERYHKINAVIEDLTQSLDELSKAKDRAWGLEKLKYIDDEIAKTEELIAAQKTYINEIKSNLSSDKKAIALYGASFDTNGNISNYDEIITQQVSKYNEAVNAFNKNQNEDAFEAAEKAYEEFKKVLDKYEETNNLLQEQQQALQDRILEELDKKLEKIKETVSMKISVREDDIEYLEYQLGKLDDIAFSTAQSLNLITTNVKALMDESDFYTKGIADILALQESGKPLLADQIDTLREYKSSLMDVNNSLLELRKTMEESVINSIEEFTDKIDKSMGRFDTYSSVMSNYANIVELSGRSSRDSALLIQLSTAMVDNSISKLTGAKEKYDALLASQQSAQENLLRAQGTGDAESIKYWEDTLEDISIKVEEAQDEMQQNWADALTAAADKFDKVVEITIAKLEDALSSFTDLDTFSDAYSKAQSAADRFLSDNEKIYELNKLNRDINKSIDNTTNLAAKTKLKEVLEEINKLQSDNVTMSKYDLDYLQAKYNLKVAEIALEEAQNAKNQVRLTRDSEGNWGYTYTADQTKIDEAQQNYDDNLQSLRQLSEDYIKDMSDQIIQNQQEMADALAGIDKNRADYTTEVARITEYYINQDMYLRQELDKAVVNSGTTYGETILGQIENAQSWQEAHQNMADSTYAALATLNTAYNEWKNNVDTVMKAAGTSSNDFTQTVKNDLDTINSKSNELEQTLEEDSQNMVSYIDTIMDKVSSWQSSYGRAISDMIKANEALMVSINKIIAAQGGMTPLSAKTGYDVSVDYSALMQSYLAAGGSNEDIINQLQTEREAKITGEGYTQEYYGRRGAEALQYMRNNPYAYYDQTKVKELLAKLGITSFASGGYTGDWGPEAKLAGIHEKEIILNADDTSNFLKAIDMVRSISNILDQKAVLASLGLLGVTSGGVLDTSSQQLSQEVTIHAEFPNATDRNEIEEAFNSLIGTASQYANRK